MILQKAKEKRREVMYTQNIHWQLTSSQLPEDCENIFKVLRENN